MSELNRSELNSSDDLFRIEKDGNNLRVGPGFLRNPLYLHLKGSEENNSEENNIGVMRAVNAEKKTQKEKSLNLTSQQGYQQGADNSSQNNQTQYPKKEKANPKLW